MLKYQEIRKDYHMILVAVETFGAWDPEEAHFIKNLGKEIQSLTGERDLLSTCSRVFPWLFILPVSFEQWNRKNNLSKYSTYNYHSTISFLVTLFKSLTQ